MSIIKRRYSLRESERKDLSRRLSEKFAGVFKRILEEKPKIEVVEAREGRIILINGKPLLIDVGGDLIPTLFSEEAIRSLPKVIVNMGAVPHICDGADIMAPGVVKIEGEFKEGDLAIVLDERYGKAIAVVRALKKSEDIKALKHGRILENLHYVGDSYWKIIKELI
ncbi:MAG: DUF1947 domain-containing protein [Candidatus Bathyarchaeia archaeon]